MNRIRKVAMVAGTVAVAMAAGQFVQQGAGNPQRIASAEPQLVLRQITPLAAEAELPPLPASPEMPRLPDQAMQPPAIETRAVIALPAEPDDCARRLDLSAAPLAMLTLHLSAPCDAGARVVLRHAGLAFTGRTDTAGRLAVDLPALATSGEVSVLFPDGSNVDAAAPVPEIAGLRRFAVQWMASDNFQINAFEDGAAYGGPGHISAARPHLPPSGARPQGGFLTVLGDISVDLPMMAEIYTFPAGAKKVDVLIEAAITKDTCAREILGETLLSEGGTVRIAELTVTMPDCSAIGDYLVLKNLVPDNSIAATN